ncbi:hypothetical protein F4V57_13590 [Acinetobacter qingfengensis]|uniref:Uncharacterized protein n=2 Tax=Acinetobacter qingfengensis TaxID=1262585 RepID=A0A1E7QWP1_9GAMM|nr:hypothetical protein F4V57_13590 [Acinetobacter qingfengensis]OEY91518.1 hypothetical protein BJI46_06715 [Acinetobacter qingfengensis]
MNLAPNFPQKTSSKETLVHVERLMQEVVSWLVKSGIGYTEFSALLRYLFYNEALKEIQNLGQKRTDSAISLLSGLNRRDVSAFRQKYGEHQLIETEKDITLLSVPARVVGLWIHKNLPHRLPINDHELSFENLVKEISTEKHPRSILSELKRLEIVFEEQNEVILNIQSFTPSPELDETKDVFSTNISDHLAAGIHNILKKDNRYLEQAIFANELTEKSILQLKVLSHNLWEEASKKILTKAIECSKEDEGRKDADQRFTFGVYQYDKIEK